MERGVGPSRCSYLRGYFLVLNSVPVKSCPDVILRDYQVSGLIIL